LIIFGTHLRFNPNLFYCDYETSCTTINHGRCHQCLHLCGLRAWEETGEPEGNPPVRLGDEMIILHTNAR